VLVVFDFGLAGFVVGFVELLVLELEVHQVVYYQNLDYFVEEDDFVEGVGFVEGVYLVLAFVAVGVLVVV
jgi:hypothetical protein